MIAQIFVAFSEKLNFIKLKHLTYLSIVKCLLCLHNSLCCLMYMAMGSFTSNKTLHQIPNVMTVVEFQAIEKSPKTKAFNPQNILW